MKNNDMQWKKLKITTAAIEGAICVCMYERGNRDKSPELARLCEARHKVTKTHTIYTR